MLFAHQEKYHLDTGHITYLQDYDRKGQFYAKLCSTHWNAIVDCMSYNTDEFKKRINNLLQSIDCYISLSSTRLYANKEHSGKK